MVRKPSEWIVSAYFYHLIGMEPWETLADPPHCNNCDHGAWLKIFGACDFKCSFNKLLLNTSMEEGLEIETQRSRWEILKMLHNMKLWQGTNALHLSLVHFANDFDATVQCMLRFYLGTSLPQGKRMQTVLKAARAAGKGSKSKYTTDPLKVTRAHERLRLLTRERESCRFLADADALYERLMMRGRKVMSRLGCPQTQRK